MRRYENLVSDPCLREILDRSNVDELKKLLALVPGITMKAPRKGDIIDALERCLLGAGVVELWKLLGSLEQSAGLWSLNEAKALKSVEKGAAIPEFRAFLHACDPQPLPETVEGFLAAIQQRGTACVGKGSALLIECASPEIAEIIARDSRSGKLCQRTGERSLVVLVDKEKPFREALNALGYGMPRV